jgi:hypothetical protein
VEAFIAGKVEPGPATSGRRVVARKDGRQLHKKTVYLGPDLARRLELCAVKAQRDQTEIMTEALEEWLARRGE